MDELIAFKVGAGLPLTIEKTDIIPLYSTKHALKVSTELKNKNGNPCNQKLLQHPVIIKTKPSSNSNEATTGLVTNLTSKRTLQKSPIVCTYVDKDFNAESATVCALDDTIFHEEAHGKAKCCSHKN